LGSGFVWDTQGHIITNNHVVDGASKVQVTFSDGMTVDAKVVGTDPNADLAVLQVNVPASQLTPVVLADSTQVKVGQIAIAIGNPYGLAGTMTEGIISGLERTLPVGLDNLTSQQGPTYSIPDIIQTDASINPGNSGGVLVDIQGQLIGVTAAIESSSGSNSGIGFVIPSAIVKKVVPSLIATGSYQHPRLGISGTSMTPDLAKAMGLDSQQNGALVIEVTPGGPAANAGLQASNQTATINGQNVPVGGDVIVAINGQSVKQFDDLSTYLFYNTSIGQTVNLTVLRNGKEQTVKVTLDALPNQ
jgi:2-alkenal reductase